MAKLVIKIPDEMYSQIKEFDGKHDVLIDRGDLYEAICNGIALDNLTNGEVIQKMFPDGKITEESYVVYAHIEECDHPFDKAWWNRKWGE